MSHSRCEWFLGCITQIAGVHPSSWIQAASGTFCSLSNPPTLQPPPFTTRLFSLDFSLAAHISATSDPVPLSHPFAPHPAFNLLPSHKSVSHQASPLSWAPFPSAHVLLAKPGSQSSFHTPKPLTSNPRFLPRLPCSPPSLAYTRATTESRTSSKRACFAQSLQLGSWSVLGTDRDFGGHFCQIPENVYWTWAKAKHSAKAGLFSHSWHQAGPLLCQI